MVTNIGDRIRLRDKVRVMVKGKKCADPVESSTSSTLFLQRIFLFRNKREMYNTQTFVHYFVWILNCTVLFHYPLVFHFTNGGSRLKGQISPSLSLSLSHSLSLSLSLFIFSQDFLNKQVIKYTCICCLTQRKMNYVLLNHIFIKNVTNMYTCTPQYTKNRYC